MTGGLLQDVTVAVMRHSTPNSSALQAEDGPLLSPSRVNPPKGVDRKPLPSKRRYPSVASHNNARNIR